MWEVLFSQAKFFLRFSYRSSKERILLSNSLMWKVPHIESSRAKMTESSPVIMNGNAKKRALSSDLELFDEVFPLLVDDLTKTGMKDSEISDALKWFKRVCDYNVPFGKKNRGLTVIHSYKFLTKDTSLSDEQLEENYKLARILGWCVEWLQAFFLVSDDIMDDSKTRRGQPCWYKQPEVKLIAINDSFYLESAIYVILKKYFRSKPYYVDVMELFHETTLQTVTGQNLDLITAGSDVDFTNFTIERYNAIVKYKTAFYSFYLPVALAMKMVECEGEQTYANAQTILLKMGEFFQIQDDYLDCFGDPAVTGKVGTDIEDNKCGWLVVQALSRCTPQQRAVLEENYAKNDPAKVARVKEVYNEINMVQVYKDYEEKSYSELLQLIDQLSGKLPKDMFLAYAQKIYKRQK